jgi:UPF0755 protein
MSEDKDYWKELLGDDFNEDLFEELINHSDGASSEKKNTEEPRDKIDPQPVEKTPEPDEEKFRTYDIKTPERRFEHIEDEAADTGLDDFDVEFDFDREYRDVPDERPIHRKREKKTGCFGGILLAAFIICISLLLASLGWMAATDVLGLSSDDTSVEVTIPQDFTIDDVAEILHDNGLININSCLKFIRRSPRPRRKSWPEHMF